MIFNLFKSKNNWQHKDSNVRIAAINEELNIENVDDKNTLLSMLNEDASELVRRAALQKLNHFDVYLNASQVNNNKPVKVFSLLQVQEILSDKHKIKLSNEEKLDYLIKQQLDQSLDISLLTHWLDHEDDPSLILNLFEVLVQKKNSAQFLLHVFTKKQSVEVQKLLLSFDLIEMNEVSILNKLSKKAANDEVTLLINSRLSELSDQKEKPKRLLKQKQLTLSKLLALKEQADYGKYITNKEILIQEWQHDLPELTCLNEDEQQILLSKFSKITAQLAQIFAPKEEAYQQAKIAESLLNDKKAAKESFTIVIAELDQKITTAVFESDNSPEELLNQKEFSDKLTQLNDEILASVLTPSEQNEYLLKTSQLVKRLTQLPEIAKSVSEATYLISKISQLTLPLSLTDLNNRQKTYYDWLKQWKEVNQTAQGVMPQSIIDAHKEITSTWKVCLKQLEHEQKQLFSQTKKKLLDIKRLLDIGKYKVCFGLFKGVSQSIVLLSDQQQYQLQRDFDFVSEKMAEVSDWEHYIATPRKQELLKQINNLITSPLDEPNTQADKVKEYRAKWNLLGHADESVDKELNDQFNIACEQAFAPCRLFYAEQEKIRAVHLITREKILEEAIKLTESIEQKDSDKATLDFKVFDGKLNKLQQRWQQAGEVDRQQYQKLFKQFKSAIQPIKNTIKNFHDDNGAKKQALIVKAEQQLLNEDIHQAIEEMKGLQRQWREVGFAGSHQESKLWQKFRAINDQVFEKREHVKSEQNAELLQLTENFKLALNNLKLSAMDADELITDKDKLVNVMGEAEKLLLLVKSNNPVIKSVLYEIESFIKKIVSQIKLLNVQQESKSWQSLFEILEIMAKNETSDSEQNIFELVQYQDLSSYWKKRINEQSILTASVQEASRVDKTLELEILANVESPEEFSARRMAVQVKMMQERMQSIDTINLKECLVDWLYLGKLEAQDIILLSRLKKIFIS
jgi:hypothetical protein